VQPEQCEKTRPASSRIALNRAIPVRWNEGKGSTQRGRDSNRHTSLPIVTKLLSDGVSLRAIAAQLNAEGRTTCRGLDWNPVQVSRVLASATA
jgi:hypothetical protein